MAALAYCRAAGPEKVLGGIRRARARLAEFNAELTSLCRSKSLPFKLLKERNQLERETQCIAAEPASSRRLNVSTRWRSEMRNDGRTQIR